MAYISKESGRAEVYIAPFDSTQVMRRANAPPALMPSGKWQVTTGGAQGPRWRGDGKEIFFLAADGHVMAAEIEAENGSLRVGAVRPLFAGFPQGSASPFDASADGKRFVLITLREEQSSPLKLVLNWPELLKNK